MGWVEIDTMTLSFCSKTKRAAAVNTRSLAQMPFNHSTYPEIDIKMLFLFLELLSNEVDISNFFNFLSTRTCRNIMTVCCEHLRMSVSLLQ